MKSIETKEYWQAYKNKTVREWGWEPHRTTHQDRLPPMRKLTPDERVFQERLMGLRK